MSKGKKSTESRLLLVSIIIISVIFILAVFLAIGIERAYFFGRNAKIANTAYSPSDAIAVYSAL
jgi:flagellar basal body-associated protein FliL